MDCFYFPKIQTKCFVNNVKKIKNETVVYNKERS